DAKLMKHALDESEWKSMIDTKITSPSGKQDSVKPSDISWEFNQLPPGAYRIEVIAHASNRIDSETGFHEFVVKPTSAQISNALGSALKGIQTPLPKAEKQ